MGQIPAYIIYTKRVQMMQANFELVLTETELTLKPQSSNTTAP